MNEKTHVSKEKIKRIIGETKVSVLEMFAYQGSPSKRWIETKGQFWEGWNQCCNKLLEELLGVEKTK